MSARVSAIVPVYNASATIEGCLRSLDGQTLDPADYEVIVVDDGSTDGSRAVVRSFVSGARARFTVVEQTENRGPAAARNAGIATATAPVLAFTDSDCQVAPDWLERALARLEEETDAAGVEGRTDPLGEPSALTHQMRNPTGGLFMTCNMVYRREPVERAGGFDERFRLAWLEDSDLAFAIMEDGGRIVWDPDVVVNHLVLHVGRRRFLREARKRLYNALLYRKHPAMYRAHLKPVTPALPGLHLKYMATVVAPFLAWAVGLPGLSVILVLPFAFYLRRVLFAHKARDPLSALQVAVHPFVQTFWTVVGAAKFKTFSWDL